MATGIENPELEKLLAEINTYRAANGDMSATAFGLWSIGDPNLLRDLKNGREPRWATIKAIRAKMAGQVSA